MVWKSARSSMVVGRLSLDGQVEAAGDLRNDVVGHAVEDLIHPIVVRLPAGAVRLDEPDAVKDEREVALDVCVDAEEQIAVRGNGAISPASNATRHAGGTEAVLPAAQAS